VVGRSYKAREFIAENVPTKSGKCVTAGETANLFESEEKMKSNEKILEPYQELIKEKNTEKIKKHIKNCGSTIKDLNKEIKEAQNLLDLVIQEKKLIEGELAKINKAKGRKNK
jgi:hypothetical protein